MIKYTPRHFLIYGIAVYLLLFFIGPYNFEIRSLTAIGYLAGAYFLWFFGIRCGRIRWSAGVEPKGNMEQDGRLTDFSEFMLVALEGMIAVGTAVYLLYLWRVMLHGQMVFGDLRTQVSQMPKIFKALQSACYLAVGIYATVSYAQPVRSRLLKVLSKIGLLSPIVLTLVTGARWSTFVILILFLTVETGNGGFKRMSAAAKLLIGLTGIVLLGVCFALFAKRGISTGFATEMPYYGTIATKDIWLIIGSTALGKPVYSIFYYFTHSVPYYASVFSDINLDNLAYGALLFRIIGFFWGGFPAYKDIVSRIPVLIGSYSTFLTGFMRDFGYIGSLVATFATGVLMGKTWCLRKRYKLAQIMQPFFLTMCILSPIYYIWHVGSIDFMIVTTVGLHYLLKLSNRIYIRKRV